MGNMLLLLSKFRVFHERPIQQLLSDTRMKSMAEQLVMPDQVLWEGVLQQSLYILNMVAFWTDPGI